MRVSRTVGPLLYAGPRALGLRLYRQEFTAPAKMSDLPNSSSSELDWIDAMLLEDWERRWTDSGTWDKPNRQLPSYLALVTDNVEQLPDSPVVGEYGRPITPPAAATSSEFGWIDTLVATQCTDSNQLPDLVYDRPITPPAVATSSEFGWIDALPATQSRDKPAPPPSKHKSSKRKPSIHWSKEEHKQFLMGLKVCKNDYDWKRISEQFVTTRTPLQVSAHARNYFLHPLKEPKNTTRKKRKSINDIRISNLDDKQVHVTFDPPS